MSAADLGLARRDAGRGLAWGGVAFALVTAFLIVAALIPAAHGFFDDDRADVGFGSMLFEVLIEVPLGTVLLEELAFRGSLLALLRRRLPVWPAVLVSSALFGLWHIGVAISSASGNAAVPDSGGGLVLTVLGTVAATTVAGIVFCWLRLRSGSLLAPMLAHTATNSVAFAVAWVLTACRFGITQTQIWASVMPKPSVTHQLAAAVALDALAGDVARALRSRATARPGRRRSAGRRGRRPTPRRACGCPACPCARASRTPMSVSTRPGATTLTCTPCSRSSLASVNASASSAALPML